MTPPPPRSTLFPYTTLFRSEMKAIVHRDGKEYQMSFEKGVRTKDLEETGEVPADQTGSSIWFKPDPSILDRKSTRLNSSHVAISYAVFCLKKKKTKRDTQTS